MENRVYNFAAGPSMLADEVLLAIKEELFNYHGSGMSVMEMSHRSKGYLEIFEKTKNGLKKLMNIPDDYEILFMHGGATGMFASIPLNLTKGKTADYIITGNFSKKAADEAKKYGDVHTAYDGKENNYTHIPDENELSFSADPAYIHLCANNTIYGTEWKSFPVNHKATLIADMSSDILSKPVNVSDFGLIYAGAQKNMGIAGIAVAIIRKDLIEEADVKVPSIMNYALELKHDSMLNTPATYPIYVLGKVVDWLEELGGLAEIEKRNIEKAKILYDYLDASKFYKSFAEKESRSLMNVTFSCGDPDLDAAFAAKAAENGLCNLKGHRLVGGLRASIYNAMPKAGVEKLIEFMDDFAREN